MKDSSTMHDARQLMRRHIEALYTLNDAGDLVRVRELDGGLTPRVFVGRTRMTTIHRFRFDVPAEIRRALINATARHCHVDAFAAGHATASTEIAQLDEILSRYSPITSTWSGPAYVCPNAPSHSTRTNAAVVRINEDNAALLNGHFSGWIPDLHPSPPLIAVVIDGRAVAVCASVRVTRGAHEAGVETASEYRGRGFASRAVAAWMRAVRELGAEALYSTSWENTASQTVARKLGLIHFGNDVHLT
jgi:RimJ/RimL family protein N-acetyltransferase